VTETQVAAPPTTATSTPTRSYNNLAIYLNPGSVPDSTLITVTGRGFPPGSQVDLEFLLKSGGVGDTSEAMAGPSGTFSAELIARDNGAPGIYYVVATDDGSQVTAPFDQTAG
jgi:hypothetical protein